ncbi:hypothetical protein [Chryseobacterium echinoideorum]|uniref:hypothetical protein n=1 Tax=Chryseobacterium echinoideorum TaxID=1549648 RepID=UPI001185DFBA|nr:hypothetical protein [Chryseobacterium echinoideorum]
MKVLLSSMAKNDIQMLMRVLNAQKKNQDRLFLNELKDSVEQIIKESEQKDIKSKELQMYQSQNFPVCIHYIFEDNESLFITAIFKI